MAVQLVDDLLDFTSRETVLGKPVGNDLREGKVTLPLMYALEQASDAERRRVETNSARAELRSGAVPQILAIVERCQGIARVKDRAQAFTEKARGIIGEFPDSPYPARCTA